MYTKEEVLNLEFSKRDVASVVVDAKTFMELFFPKNSVMVSQRVFDIAQQARNLIKYSEQTYEKILENDIFSSDRTEYNNATEELDTLDVYRALKATTNFFEAVKRVYGAQIHEGLIALFDLAYDKKSGFGQYAFAHGPPLTSVVARREFEARIAKVNKEFVQGDGATINLHNIYVEGSKDVWGKAGFAERLEDQYLLTKRKRLNYQRYLFEHTDAKFILALKSKDVERLRIIANMQSSLWQLASKKVQVSNLQWFENMEVFCKKEDDPVKVIKASESGSVRRTKNFRLRNENDKKHMAEIAEVLENYQWWDLVDTQGSIGVLQQYEVYLGLIDKMLELDPNRSCVKHLKRGNELLAKAFGEAKKIIDFASARTLIEGKEIKEEDSALAWQKQLVKQYNDLGENKLRNMWQPSDLNHASFKGVKTAKGFENEFQNFRAVLREEERARRVVGVKPNITKTGGTADGASSPSKA